MLFFVKKSLFLVIFLFSLTLSAQVGIGTPTPDPQAMLDVQSTDKGILIPRLADHTTISPTASSDFGLLVFDTTTNSFWYWDGTAWNEMWSSSSSNAWELTGNPGTTAGTNYIGTSDAVDLVIARAGTEEIRILSNQVSINDSTPFTGDRFTVVGDTDEYAINGYASGTGWGVYGEGSIGVFGTGLVGIYGSVDGASVSGYFGAIANNNNSAGTGLLAAGGNAGLVYLPGTGATLSGPSLAGAAFASNATGTGFSGVGNGGITSNTLSGGSGLAGTGVNTGVYGNATGSGGSGVYGLGANTTDGTGVVGAGNGETPSVLTEGSGVAGTGLTIGVYGNASTAAQEDSWGGYFESNGTWAYVGGRIHLNGNNYDEYSLYGNGAIMGNVLGKNGDLLLISYPASPEVLFQDYGTGKLSNGYAKIEIDPNLSVNIRVDEEHPLKVFIQLEGDCNGVYVTDKSATSFEVKELKNGKSNVPFSWSLVATRASKTVVLENGDDKVSDYGKRFQPAPEPMKSVRKETSKLEANKQDAKNTPSLKVKKEKK